MTKELFGLRKFAFSDENCNQERLDLYGKEGSLIQLIIDYEGWYVVSGKSDANDRLRHKKTSNGVCICFLPGDVALYLGSKCIVDKKSAYYGYWKHRLLWGEAILETTFTVLAPDNLFNKYEAILLQTGDEPWDCSELIGLEVEYRKRFIENV